MAVDTTTYLADAKNVYGAIQDQVNSEAIFCNLLGDGSKFGKISSLGIRGYTFLARLQPNWNLGYRLEGYTGVSNSAASPAGNQGLNNATVLLKYAYVPTVITGQAEILTKGDGRAFMQAKALEAKFDMKDIIAHVNVVMVAAERGGQLATVLTVTSATVLILSTAGNLPGALYMRVGMPITSGPVGGGANNMPLSTITAVNYSTNTITTNNAGASAVVGDAITLAGEAALTTGTFPVTSEGLMSLVTATGNVQGLDPATAGQTPWQAYVQDMAGAVIDPASFTALNQFVKIRSGEEIDLQLFPPSQINQLVSIATATLAFQTQPSGQVGKKALDLGYTSYEFGGKTIVEEKDCRYDRIFSMATSMFKKFEALPLSMADDEAGSWTRISGANGPADAVMGLLRWYHNLGTLQRNAAGLQKNYAVPATFANQPPNF